MNMIDQGGNGYAHERPSGRLSRSSFGWGSLAGGIAIALVASASSASAGAPKKTIHADILVTNSALGSGGLGGQVLGSLFPAATMFWSGQAASRSI
jgi:hypothetical protein